jgi:hypothetical protein
MTFGAFVLIAGFQVMELVFFVAGWAFAGV